MLGWKTHRWGFDFQFRAFKKTLLVGLKDFLLGWKYSFGGGRFLAGALTSSSEPLNNPLLVGLEDFLLGWKSSFWGGRFLGGALTSSSAPLQKHSLLGWKISCWVGNLPVGVEDFLVGL